MQPELQNSTGNSTGKRGKKNIIIISLIVFSLLMLATSAQLIYMTLKYDRVYKGVYINGMDAGGMAQVELALALKSRFQDKIKDLEITLDSGRIVEKASYTDLNVSYVMDNAVKDAFSLGRTGNMFKRLYAIFNAGLKGANVDMPLSYDKGKLDNFISEFHKKTLIEVKEAEILIQDDKVTIRTGRHGENIDKNSLTSTLNEMINSFKGGTVKVEIIITPPNKLDAEDLFPQLNREPVNAAFKVLDGNISVEPHITGMKIEKTALEDIVADLEKNENTEMVLPVQYILPEITTEKANEMVFKDQIAYMSTHFSTSNENDKNRGENIKLATSKINGIILIPGAVFSFNDVVGPRTEADGYKLAHTYVAGKVIDGIGGGICQVSTTIYGAVLKSDLEVIERRNHMFTVGYVPYGQDATVSYGTTDFRFRNSTNWPIKIEAGVNKDNNVFFKFIGTIENPEKKVIISQEILKRIPFTTKYIDNPTMLEGKTSVKQEGKEGYVVDTFKTIKISGKVISETKLHTSTYRPLTEEILRGTKKPEATDQMPAATPAPTSTPQTGVDDADNPPAE
ncbi:MAG: vanomycin resistance protein VanB [Ruminiclostridium sp.]|nr:vanomycin resistance protein VanB [Ruminiclostridium sp.]